MQQTRNTPLVAEIVKALGDHLPNPEGALAQLEEHFGDEYILNAGNFAFVADAAQQLRLAVKPEECFAVMDYIAAKNMVGITIDHVETAINDLFEDRFIEP